MSLPRREDDTQLMRTNTFENKNDRAMTFSVRLSGFVFPSHYANQLSITILLFSRISAKALFYSHLFCTGYLYFGLLLMMVELAMFLHVVSTPPLIPPRSQS